METICTKPTGSSAFVGFFGMEPLFELFVVSAHRDGGTLVPFSVTRSGARGCSGQEQLACCCLDAEQRGGLLGGRTGRGEFALCDCEEGEEKEWEPVFCSFGAPVHR